MQITAPSHEQGTQQSGCTPCGRNPSVGHDVVRLFSAVTVLTPRTWLNIVVRYRTKCANLRCDELYPLRQLMRTRRGDGAYSAR